MPGNAPKLANAFGGVLVDDLGQVLLRRPKGEYDGYVWTFAKGRPDPGELPAQAALREVKEETGYEASIVMKLPGQFAGGTTVTEFFLMAPVGEPVLYDQKETAEVSWVALAEAGKLIKETRNAMGRARDLAVLAAAQVAVRDLKAK